MAADTLRERIAQQLRDHDWDNVPAADSLMLQMWPIIERALAEKDARLEIVHQALGLLTTLHGQMVIDVNDPMGMAQQIHAHVAEKDAQIAALQQRLDWIEAFAERGNFTHVHDELHEMLHCALRETPAPPEPRS